MDKTVLISSGRCGTQLIHQSLAAAGYNVIGEPISNEYAKIAYPDLLDKYGVEKCEYLNEQKQKLMNPQYIDECFQRTDLLSLLYYIITPEITNYLVDKKIRIFHVKRKNHLLRYLSLQNALKTRIWATNKIIHNTPIILDPINFIDNLAYNRKFESTFNKLGTDIFYEDLILNNVRWNKNIEKITCDTKNVPQITKKIINLHPHNMISNLNELYQYPEISAYLNMCKLHFNYNVFTRNIDLFTKYLGHLKDVKSTGLEIGSLEGRSATWTAQFLPQTTLHCVDPAMPRYADVLRKNVSYFPNIKLHECKSVDFQSEEWYDYVYVDGDHTFEGCLSDLYFSFSRLKSGGILIVDDYEFKMTDGPKRAVDKFIGEFADKLEVLYKDYIVIVRKICA